LYLLHSIIFLLETASSAAKGYVVLLDSALVVSALVDPRTTEQCWSGWKSLTTMVDGGCISFFFPPIKHKP
jgi:hypothetical protein